MLQENVRIPFLSFILPLPTVIERIHFPPRSGYQTIFKKCGCSCCGYAACLCLSVLMCIDSELLCKPLLPILWLIRHSNSHTSTSLPTHTSNQRTWAHWQCEPLLNYLCPLLCGVTLGVLLYILASCLLICASPLHNNMPQKSWILNSPHACRPAHWELWPSSPGSAPWMIWRRTERSTSPSPRPQTQDLHPSRSAASAESPTHLRPGYEGAASRMQDPSSPAWLPSWLSTAAARSAGTGAAIPARSARRQGRDPPDTASPTPGAPSACPGASHISRSGWKYQECQSGCSSLWVAEVSVSHQDWQVIAQKYHTLMHNMEGVFYL